MKPVGDLRNGQWTELPVDHQHLNPEREERRAVELRGYLVRADNQIVDFRVLDLSYERQGSMVEGTQGRPAVPL